MDLLLEPSLVDTPGQVAFRLDGSREFRMAVAILIVRWTKN